MKYSDAVLERAKQAVKIGNAIIEGKDILYTDIGDTKYLIVGNPLLNFSKYDYKVQEKPEYIPFTFEDAEFLIDKNIKHKTAEYIQKITFISTIFVEDVTFDVLLKDFTFLDGSPCGKLKQ